jgi:hypothetical protein
LEIKMDVNNFQRVGSISNAHAGREFEQAAQLFFARQGIDLISNFGVEVGFAKKKIRKFDLGSSDPAVVVECKSHNWTQGATFQAQKLPFGMSRCCTFISRLIDTGKYFWCSGASGAISRLLSIIYATTAILSHRVSKSGSATRRAVPVSAFLHVEL